MAIQTDDKTKMEFGVRPMTDITTGEKRNRAYLSCNNTTRLDELAKSLSGDYGLRAGKPSHVREVLLMSFEKIYEELKLGNRPVIDGFGSFSLTLRGPVDPNTGWPTTDSRIGVVFTPGKEMDFSIDAFEFVCKDGTPIPPRFSSVTSCTENAEPGKVVRGKDIRIYGSRLRNDAAMGDSLTLSFTDASGEQTVALTPSEVEPSCMKIPFPMALGETPAGTELTFTLTNHMGASDGPTVSCSKAATLVEA